MSAIGISQNVYVPLMEARDMLASRKKMQDDIMTWWKENGLWLNPLAQNSDRAVIGRQLATFRYEDGAFACMAERAGMKPLWMEYRDDLVSTQSLYKRSLLKPTFMMRRGKNNGAVLQKIELAKIQNYIGKPLSHVLLENKDQQIIPDPVSFVDFHHRQLFRCYPQAWISNGSYWVMQMGRAIDYYPAYLSLFLAHGVLFEDFDDDASLGPDQFHAHVFRPAFKRISELFGVQPLIVKLPCLPELNLYPAQTDWKNHGIIPDEYLF